MSAFVRRVLAIRQDCAYCGELCSYGDYGPRYATIDHIVPRARGGHEGKSNKTLACLHCNRSKGSLPHRQLRNQGHSRDNP